MARTEFRVVLAAPQAAAAVHGHDCRKWPLPLRLVQHGVQRRWLVIATGRNANTVGCLISGRSRQWRPKGEHACKSDKMFRLHRQSPSAPKAVTLTVKRTSSCCKSQLRGE